jgi:dTMP kinase
MAARPRILYLESRFSDVFVNLCPVKKGVFISFEGSDGAGKSTQIKLLQNALKKQKHKVYVTREPGGTKLGEKLRNIIIHQKMNPVSELLLFEACRAELVSKELKPRLEKKYVILCDRYEESSIVFQGIVRKLGVALVKSANKIATQGLKSDLIVLLDPKETRTTTTRMSRRNKDRFEREGSNFHKAIQAGYRRLARSDRRFKKYNANLDRQSIHKMILKDVEKLLSRRT